jgi:2-keto-3-deoxy-L-rhamnonate aldolase RhmA
MVPMLETVEQAEKLVEWAKFAPVGKRGLGSLGGHTNFGGLGGSAHEFMERANKDTLTIAQIETGLGVENVEKIAAMEGIDALLIGPNDLAISLGVPGDLLGDTVDSAIAKVADAASKNGKVFGLHAPDALLDRWIPKGCNMIMSGLDSGIVANGLKAIADKYHT